MRIISYALILLMSSFIACTQPEKVPLPYRSNNAHENYLISLQQANLAETALGKDWIAAAEAAISEPVDISSPFEETFYADSRSAFALAYRFDVIRGHRTTIEVVRLGEKPARIFIDLFRWASEDRQTWERVASAPKGESRLEFEPRLNARYIARIQPELLRGGQFTITIRNQASLEFPVQGYDRRSIGSGFGEPRDGGRRKHHGVDIFARRHTPIIAPVDGYIRRVGEQRLGGRTIWMRDGRVSDKNMYFAHLQDYKVEEGAEVKAGQIIGTVGNTGNARTTPPHLHFGIYYRGLGAVDPMNFILKVNDTPNPISADIHPLGHWVRTQDNNTTLRNSAGSPVSKEIALEQHTPLQVLAAASNMYRVQLPDGESGYITADMVESLEENLEVQTLPGVHSLTLKEAPHIAAVTMDIIDPGIEIVILGEYRGYLFVRTQEGQKGWLAAPQPSPAESLRDSPRR